MSACVGLEVPEQTWSLAWSSTIYWARLGAALQARTASALWSTNCKGQLSASSTQQDQPSHVLRCHTNVQFTPDKYLHGRRIKSVVSIMINISCEVTSNSQASAILRALCVNKTWCVHMVDGLYILGNSLSSGQHLSLQKH